MTGLPLWSDQDLNHRPSALPLDRGEIPPDSPEILQKIAENVPMEPLPPKRELNPRQQVACWTPVKSLATCKKTFNANYMQNLVPFGYPLSL